MSNYPNLLRPIKVGNVYLKNRMVSTNALPHYLQGSENFPAEPVINHVASCARNGAAIVSFGDWADPHQRTAIDPSSRRMPMFDLTDPSVHNYMSQMADAVHFYGSKFCICLMEFGPRGLGVKNKPAIDTSKDIDLTDMDAIQDLLPQLFAEDFGEIKAMTAEQIRDFEEEVAQKALFYKKLGFDMCDLHMAYRLPIFAQFLSPLVNDRTDEYGGSLENRARFPLETCKRIKELCGQDFLIEIEISGEEKKGGMTLEEVIAFAHMADGLIDIFQIRAWNDTDSHPTGFNSVEGEPVTLKYCEAMKKANVPVLVEPVGGYQDPDLNEKFLAEGKCDLIGMARAFICEPNYFEKIYEGRPEDITPCIRCNKCHVPYIDGPWHNVCSVNPAMGQAHRLKSLIPARTKPRKVAIIGGGVSGMEAAIVAAQRGHSVVLFEKSDRLGGQMLYSDYASFKWPIRNFKAWQIRQVEKLGVEVRLNTAATPEMIQAEGFDVVLAAVGSRPKRLNIPGCDGANVHAPLSVYGDHERLGKKIVVIGGSESGAETGLYLAMNGHEVTVLTRQKVLAPEAAQVHYVEMLHNACKWEPNFSHITQATTLRIDPDGVVYRNADGAEQKLLCDDVILSGGVEPCMDEALKFYGSAERFYLIGDCDKTGSIQTCMRSAFATASQI